MTPATLEMNGGLPTAARIGQLRGGCIPPYSRPPGVPPRLSQRGAHRTTRPARGANRQLQLAAVSADPNQQEAPLAARSSRLGDLPDEQVYARIEHEVLQMPLVTLQPHQQPTKRDLHLNPRAPTADARGVSRAGPGAGRVLCASGRYLEERRTSIGAFGCSCFHL